MTELDGTEPIDDDERLYRRIPVSKDWYANNELIPDAFDPRSDEHSGISIYRAKYKSLEEAAQGKSKKGYFVAVFRAGDLKAKGIVIIPRPETPGGRDPGHAEITSLTFQNRTTQAALDIKLTLCELALDVAGPFRTLT